MSDAAPQPYSPRQRTALVLAGTGTAGAYQAGVLRALAEAGVRIDLVAGRGMGAVTALYAAVDAAATLWEPAGIWIGPSRPGALSVARRSGRSSARSSRWRSSRWPRRLIVLLALAVAWLPAFLLELVAPPLAGRFTTTLAEWAFWVTRGETATAAVSRAAGRRHARARARRSSAPRCSIAGAAPGVPRGALVVAGARRAARRAARRRTGRSTASGT